MPSGEPDGASTDYGAAIKPRNVIAWRLQERLRASPRELLSPSRAPERVWILGVSVELDVRRVGIAIPRRRRCGEPATPRGRWRATHESQVLRVRRVVAGRDQRLGLPAFPLLRALRGGVSYVVSHRAVDATPDSPVTPSIKCPGDFLFSWLFALLMLRLIFPHSPRWQKSAEARLRRCGYDESGAFWFGSFTVCRCVVRRPAVQHHLLDLLPLARHRVHGQGHG